MCGQANSILFLIIHSQVIAVSYSFEFCTEQVTVSSHYEHRCLDFVSFVAGEKYPWQQGACQPGREEHCRYLVLLPLLRRSEAVCARRIACLRSRRCSLSLLPRTVLTVDIPLLRRTTTTTRLLE